jgi:RNA polymerase sigma factor (sigma-70 family)
MTESELLALVQAFLAAPRRQATPDQTMAWEDFYHRCDPLVVRFARRCERQPDDADDLHQEIWRALGQSLPRLHLDPSKGNLRQWLFGVARRVRGKYRHRGGPRPANTQDPELLDDLVDPASVGDNETDRQLLLERVRETTLQYAATLSQRNRQIVVGHWIAGRTVQQLAAALGVSKKCVGSVLHRAKATIRRMLAPECVDRR